MEVTKDTPRVQVLTTAGYVHDLSVDQWQMALTELRTGAEWVEAEDIYGGVVQFRCAASIDSTRLWTHESGAKYRELHPDEEDTL